MSENKKEKNRNQEERTEEKQERQDKQVEEYGQLTLEDGEAKIHLLNIIGEIEGHECLPSNSKTTKYEHVIPQLAALEDSKTIQGLLVLINTVGGDVESGLAIAEMISSLSKPTVSLVLGLFFYCADRDDDDPSGADDRADYRGGSDL